MKELREKMPAQENPNYSAMLNSLSCYEGKPIFPYVVSVAGHEDCCREDNVHDNYRYTRTQIENTFSDQLQGLVTAWHEKCGDNNIPFIVLSSLTKGADQIAVDVALQQKFREQGVRVLAVLPTVCEFFRETLVDDRFNKIKVPEKDKDRVKEDFDGLLNRIKKQDGDTPNNEYVFELPFVSPNEDGKLIENEELNQIAKELKELSKKVNELKDDYPKEILEELCQKVVSQIEQEPLGADKDETPLKFQYSRLADFLAVHSHVLFAFWDGLPQKGLSGTDKVVIFKLLGNQRYFSDCDYLTYPSVGLVAQIFTTRDDNNVKNEITPQNAQGDAKNGYDFSQPPFKLFPQNNLSESEVRLPVFLWSREELVDDNNCPRVPEQADMNAQNACKGLIANEKYLEEVFKRLGMLNSYVVDNFDEIDSGLNQSVDYLFQHGKIIDRSSQMPKFSKRVLERMRRFFFQSRKPSFKKPRKKYSTDEDLIKELRQNLETNVLLEHYAAVDQLAKRFQGFTQLTIFGYLFLTFLFVFLGGVVSVLGTVLPKDAASTSGDRLFDWMLLKFSPSVFPSLLFAACFYVIAIIFIIMLYIKSHESEYHLAFHRCRCMAEALRVQIFWRMAGISDGCSGYYHSHQTLKTDWLRTGLLGLDVLFKSSEKKELVDLEKIQEYWLKGQTEYFKNKSNERYDKAGDSKFGRRLLVFAFVFVAIQPVYADCVSWIYGHYGLIGALFLAIIPWFLMGWFTVFTLYNQMNRLNAEGERYERGQYPFARAAYCLTNPNINAETKERILMQLGSEALTENADWYLAAGERELMLPR